MNSFAFLSSSTSVRAITTYSVGDGWLPLTFGAPGTFASQSIAFTSNNSTLVSLADTGAIGDTYFIFNNGTFLAELSAQQRDPRRH